MSTLLAILPIFAVIALGFVGGRRGFFPPEFTGPANRLVFYIAVPALLFKAMAGAPVQTSFQPLTAFLACAAQVLVWVLVLMASRFWLGPETVAPRTRASWAQSSVHGNLSIMALSVIYYSQGEAGVGAAGFIVTCLVVLQNAVSVITLSRWGDGSGQGHSLWTSLLLNPVILSTLAGLGAAFAGWKLPEVLDRTLSILANMGLPLALLLVGSIMSRSRLGGNWAILLSGQAVKLVLLPLAGWGLLALGGAPVLPLVVAVILLAAPSATLSVIMAGEMGGDSEFASQAVSLGHALCALTYLAWLWLLPSVSG